MYIYIYILTTLLVKFLTQFTDITYMNTSVHDSMHAYTQTPVHTCVRHSLECINAHTDTHTHSHAHMRTDMHAYVHTSHIHTQECTRTCIHTHIFLLCWRSVVVRSLIKHAEVVGSQEMALPKGWPRTTAGP